MTHTLPLPEVVGPYRVLRPLARGGMAEVYEVEDPATGEHLALKVLVKAGGALPRFKREYEAMIRLNHPNIVRVFGYGVWEAHPWLAMELIEGTPIQAYAKRCGRPGSPERTREVIRVAHDLALALDHVHQRGLIHRDLKSANVLVLPDGRVKLLDFGTAKVSDPVQEITRDGEFIGTFAYASPEQLLNESIDHRADLYSFGVLLYRLVTGKRPFDAKELHLLARQHVKDPPRPPGEICTLPPGLEAVILALLEKKPRRRPQSGAEVAEALEHVAGAPLYPPGTLDVDRSSERLIGREEQVGALWAFLEGAAAGGDDTPGRRPADMAITVGVQGSGRHRVMQVMEREVRERGWRILTLPFRRGTEDLDQVTESLLELSVSFTNPNATVRGHIDQLRDVAYAKSLSIAERLEVLRHAAAQLIEARCQADGVPAVLFVRGLQNAGPVGFEAIVGLREEVRRCGAPLLLLADCDEAADDPESIARKRLPDALRVHLQPMDVRGVALLVGSMLHRRPPPASVARRIFRASGGLPTYVEEVLNSLVAGGLLRVRSHDVNRIEWAQQTIDIPVPMGAQSRVTENLAALPADRRRMVEALALCGGEAHLTTLAGALQCRPAELTLGLEDLAARGWCTLERRDRVPYARLRQVMAQQVVLDRIHPCRRRVLERLLIEQVAEQPAFAAQIRLLLQVGRTREAFERARDWALAHLARDRPVTALDVLDDVMKHVDDDTTREDPGLTAQLYLLYATCLQMARPTDPQLARSLVRAARGREPGDLFEAELRLMKARIQRVIGHYANFRKELMEAWYIVEHREPSPLGATIASMLGWSARMEGHVDDAASWHGRARRIAGRVGVPTVQAYADVGVASWQLARGLLGESEGTAMQCMETFAAHDDLRGMSLSIPVWVDSLRMQGRWSEAIDLLYRQMPAMRECEAPTFYVRLLLPAAWCEVDLGRLGRAQEYADELGATLRRGEHLHLRLQADLLWARIQVASGLFEKALHQLHTVQRRADRAGLAIQGEVARALAGEVLWGMGQQREATQSFTTAVLRLRQYGDLPALAEACSAQARAMAEAVDPDRVFRPIRELMESQPAVALRLELLVARGRYHAHQKRDALPLFEEARERLLKLTAPLDPTDAAALRLHPWTRHIRKAGLTLD